MKSITHKFYSILSMLVLCLCVNYAQAKDVTDWKVDGLKGKVKEVRVYNVKEIAPRKFEKTSYRRIRRYDKKGNRTVEENYNEYDEKEGELSSRLTYKYKKKKNLTERYEYDNDKMLIEKALFNSDKILLEDEDYIYGVNYRWRTVNKYDQNGKIIEESHYVNDSLSDKVTFSYDAKGNITEESHSDSPTRWENRKYVNKYDDDDNCIEISEYNHAGKLNYTTVFKYEGKRCIEESTYDSNGERNSHTVNKYNAEGKKIESIHIVSDNELMQRDVYIIDEKGKTSVSLRYDPDGGLGRIAVSKMDDAGNPIESMIYCGDDWIFYFGTIYEYDYYKR